MAILGNYYAHLYSNCPVVELRGYCARHKLPGSILAYLDFGGATGSAKDGLAEGMLALAAEAGLLKKGQPVVEASSGTFAVATQGADAFSGATGTETAEGDTVDVDALTGATVTSKAVVRCVNSAVAYVTGADTESAATSWGG